MQVTMTEFRRHFGAYLKRSQEEMIVITRRGKPVAKLIGWSPLSVIDELYGSVPNTVTLEEAKAKRAAKQLGISEDATRSRR